MTIGQGRVSALALVVVVCALAGAPLCAQAVQHQVGGAPGWSLPSLANVNYTVWATTQTFVVGDTLYFNYSKAYHNVLEVTKANYESCTASNPLSTHDDGATIISLNKTGTFYFICGIPTHCSLGQELVVNVGNAPASAPPAHAVQHQVGGPPGWSLPSVANVNYTVWATTQTFLVGDTLYFNYSKAYHNVLEVTKANYESCTASNPLSTHDDGATIIPLNKTGTFYFICGIPTHCSLGQELAVTVGNASASAPASTPTTSPASSPSPTVSAVPPSSPAPAVSAPEGSPPPGSLGNSSLPPVPSPPSSASAVTCMLSTVFAAAVSYLGIFLL